MTLREKRSDQWVDIEQIAGNPEIFEFCGDITREEIDGALMRIGRMNSPDALKIETKLNAETSVEYIKSNPGNCKRKKFGADKRPDEGNQTNQDNETPTHQAGEEKEKDKDTP